MRFIRTLLFLLLCFPVSGAVYFVDPTATGGGNTGTNWANAWTNFSSVRWFYNYQVWPSVGAGDTLYIKEGTYESDGAAIMLYIFGGPDADSKVTVAATNGPVIFDGLSSVHLATNVNWNGNGVGGNKAFVFDGGSATNFILRNWYNTNQYTHAAAIGNCSPEHAIMRGFVVTNAGSGLTINPAVDLEIDHFRFEYIRGDHCMYIVAGATTVDNVKIHHGWFKSNTTKTEGGGPDGASADIGTSIYNCEFWNVPLDNPEIIGAQHPDAIQGGGNNLRIYNNVFHNWTGASHSSDPPGPTITNIVYAGNLFVYDDTNFIVCTVLSSGYVEPLFAMRDIYWLNNSVVDYGAASSGGIGYEWNKVYQTNHPVCSNIVFKNNLFYRVGQSGAAVAAFGSYVNTNFQTSDIILSNNITYYDALGGGTDWSTATLAGEGNVRWTQTPLMTNAPTFVRYTRFSSTNDFNIAAGDTVAKGQGLNLSDLFTALGLPLIDIDGTTRPASAAWTIGAYEAAGTPESPLPPAQSGSARASKVYVRTIR